MNNHIFINVVYIEHFKKKNLKCVCDCSIGAIFPLIKKKLIPSWANSIIAEMRLASENEVNDAMNGKIEYLE